jgi:hypothetical protein
MGNNGFSKLSFQHKPDGITDHSKYVLETRTGLRAEKSLNASPAIRRLRNM